MTKGQMLQDPFLNLLRKEKVPVSDLSRERHQAPGDDRFLRPVCRAVEEQRQPDGIQARDFDRSCRREIFVCQRW